MEKLEFIDENGEKTQFYVIEETRINGINYLLVSESDNEDEEAEAYILKDTSDAASEEAVYEFVEEDSELESNRNNNNHYCNYKPGKGFIKKLHMYILHFFVLSASCSTLIRSASSQWTDGIA